MNKKIFSILTLATIIAFTGNVTKFSVRADDGEEETTAPVYTTEYDEDLIEDFTVYDGLYYITAGDGEGISI